jgi:hypothetical protein
VGAVKFFGSRRASSRSAEELGEAELRARVESVLASAVGRAPDLEPLTRDRIVAWLEDSGFTYFIDSDGDVGGVWHGWMFYFLALGEHGEVLQVRGQWHRALTIERLEEVLEVCNEWNAERIWPKAYVRVRDDGTVVVCADVTVDVEHGANDDQLDQLLQCGLTTGSMFFEHLDEVFPDPLLGAP